MPPTHIVGITMTSTNTAKLVPEVIFLGHKYPQMSPNSKNLIIMIGEDVHDNDYDSDIDLFD